MLRMAPQALVPLELRKRPFNLADARRHGLTKHHLEGEAWRRLGAGFYAWKEIASDPLVILGAIRRRLPDRCAFAGRTAAWLHGLDFPPCDPVEVAIPLGCGVSGRAGVKLRRVELHLTEVVIQQDLPTTSATRTLADLGRWLPLLEAVIALDMGLHEGVCDVYDLADWIDTHPGFPGVARLRRALALADADSESVMETLLRLLLIQAGLPKPLLQVPLYDDTGGFLGRPDLFYPAQRLGLEYDGAVHKDNLAADNRRQNRLLDAGYRLLRFTASDVHSAPDSVVQLVRRALTASAPTTAGNGRDRDSPKGVAAGKGRYGERLRPR